MTGDAFDDFRVTPEQLGKLLQASVPTKIRKRREQFVKFPMAWFDQLKGATGQTHRVALYLLHLSWKAKGAPIKLGNGMLERDGVSQFGKWRALADLERRGLIVVERRPRRSPVVRVNMLQGRNR